MSKGLAKKMLISIPLIRLLGSPLYRLLPKRFTLSSEYNKWYDFIDSSQWWSKEQHIEYQWELLKKLLGYCNQNVPYYRELFKKMGAHPNDFKSFDDFAKIPLLTKELIREQVENLISTAEKRSHILRYNTGGSTGDPLIIYKTRNDDLIENAFMNNQWGRVGFKSMDSRVIIRGEVIGYNKLWDYHPSTNSWIFSSFHLSSEFISQMVDKLNKIKPKFLHVYPASLWIFANLIKENKLKLSFRPQAILCGSEKLFDHQRVFFSEVFGCRSFSWLGLAEQTVLAGECEYSSELHIFPQYSFVELINEKGFGISEPGITGQIVGTTFHRFSFPFLRYMSGDLATYAEGSCECGRQYRRFEKVDGRIQNVIVSKDGRIIPLTALVFGQHLLAFNKIVKMQIYQKEKGIVDVRLIRGAKFTNEDAVILCDQLSSSANYTVVFTVSYHDKLESTITGKHKFLIQQLPVEFYNFSQNG